ncbi:hypothetical protein NGF75_04380 [Dietzia kunjamensis]|uniref:hypothetical protein n=1 Tax=Dietzia kunjamensis TaxID=322509 RepID=UPI002DB976ED|nr:hypothetical protein [Dietzia kunjamensis]MEB8325223.1 hypothetical protein [Dietzia kunjamensis]
MDTTGSTRRITRRPTVSVGAFLAATAVALTAAVTAPATANAQDSSQAIPLLFPAPDRLIAAGGSPSGTCMGIVSTTLNGDGYPASASVSWGFGVLGVGPCNLTATLSWRNLDTGATGEKVAQVPFPRFSTGIPDPISSPQEAIISTGVGRVEYRLTTTGGAVAGPIVVETVPYDG